MACLRPCKLYASAPHRCPLAVRFATPASACHTARLRPCSAIPNDDRAGDSSGGVESMFAKELERRQKMSKAAAVEDAQSTATESPAATPPPPQAPVPPPPSQIPQFDRARALSSEGIEGLIPRARLLLQVGVTFFLGFLPLIAVVGGLFGGLYFGFGDQFVHGGEATSSVPAYVDPYALLTENYNDPYYPTGQ